MILLDGVATVFVFFAVLAFLYMILLGVEYKRVIPDAVYRNKEHEFYFWWKNFSILAFLLIGAGFILLSMYRSNTDDSRWLYLGLGLFGVLSGLALMYWVNRKAINLYDPEYIKRQNPRGEEKKKKNKEEEK